MQNGRLSVRPEDRFEIWDVARTGDWMTGPRDDCIAFLRLCRGLTGDEAYSLLWELRFEKKIELPELELVIMRSRD